MTRRSIQFLVLVSVCCLVLISCSSEPKVEEPADDITSVQLLEANSACIDTEIHDIVMQSDIEGTVEITVQIPNYEELYKQAYESEDPDEYILQALKSGKFDSCERIITARVTVENGDQMVHTDEALKELLEQEFSNAINVLMEEQG